MVFSKLKLTIDYLFKMIMRITLEYLLNTALVLYRYKFKSTTHHAREDFGFDLDMMNWSVFQVNSFLINFALNYMDCVIYTVMNFNIHSMIRYGY